MASAPPTTDSHAEGLDLNEASAEAIAGLCGLGDDRARRVVAARPVRDWDDVARLEGFDAQLLTELMHAGARIGGAAGGGDRPGREASG